MENKQEKNEMEVRQAAAGEDSLQGISTYGAITPDGGSSVPTEVHDPQKYPLSPFSLNRDETEHIGLGSGNLNLTVTDFVLPGKNGFDLKVTRTYNSMMANVTDLTTKEVRAERYVWYITLSCDIRDVKTDEEYFRRSIYLRDPTVGYKDTATAKKAGAQWLKDNDYRKGGYIEVEIGGRDREVEIIRIHGFNSEDAEDKIQTKEQNSKIAVSDLRFNNHLIDSYGLGLGWGFNFPAVESVKKDQYKDENKYYRYLHVEDGQVFPFEEHFLSSDGGPHEGGRVVLENHELADFEFYLGFRLEYKDGRKAYFKKIQIIQFSYHT